MIWGLVKQISRTIREICYFKKIITKYGEHLCPGRYCLFPSLRAIAVENPTSMEHAKRYFKKNIQPSKTTDLINRINATNYYRNKSNTAGELYEAVYSANNYDKVREIKLFSFERKEILTICTCEEARQKQLEEYEALHLYYGMPHLERRELYDHAYRISMVELAPRPDEQMALENIVKCVCAYRQAHLQEEKLLPVDRIIQCAYELQVFNDLLAQLTEKIAPKVRTLKIPLCFQHGDLSRDNLIYGTCDGKTDFWWIDWEHARPRLFFYDYFFYILNTAVYFQDTTALRAYLDGAYDDQLRRYFSQFCIQYEPGMRKDYFLIFAVDFLKERVCDRGNQQALKMYLAFVNQMVWDKE